MHAKNFVTGKFLEQSVLQHLTRATQTLFGRLKHNHRGAVKIPCGSQMFGRPEQHCGVAVMPTGMHHAGIGRGIIKPRRLVDRQRIHICAQPHTAVALTLAPDQRDDTGFAKTRMDLIHAIFPQLFGNDSAGAHLGETDLWMGVQVAKDRFEFSSAIGNGGKDVHGSLRFWLGAWWGQTPPYIKPEP